MATNTLFKRKYITYHSRTEIQNTGLIFNIHRDFRPRKSKNLRRSTLNQRPIANIQPSQLRCYLHYCHGALLGVENVSPVLFIWERPVSERNGWISNYAWNKLHLSKRCFFCLIYKFFFGQTKEQTIIFIFSIF